MILFFRTRNKSIIAVQAKHKPNLSDIEKLNWLFGESELIKSGKLDGDFVGPRKEMITPWSTNAVEITQNMGIQGITRIEEFFSIICPGAKFDRMLQAYYSELNQSVFHINKKPEPVYYIEDIEAYNEKEGLALSAEEIEYLRDLSLRINRRLTDSEVFGFSQVNSEHCRHKIFNGIFIIDGEEKKSSLFDLIRLTTKTHPNKIISAYQDNCSFNEGPVIEQFAPATQDKPDYFEIKDIKSVLSLKAETHNFPTTVEPFNGAATGTGGEIRDRIGGGKGALPLAGTAVYMTSYPRPDGGRAWEKNIPARKWLYQTPEEILIKASNGASDFGNKFGQPLICGSLFTFEHFEGQRKFGFDKVIMLAGGVGYGKLDDSKKDVPRKEDLVILLGGDNYRIGMGGGAVSSVATGEYGNKIELNAVQRANPEMQKRVYNAIRAISESGKNSIITVHDHGAGGHLNCLSELVEATGGEIEIQKLPLGDPTLSAREIVGNESQERMGLVINKEDAEKLQRISERERAPFYIIGKITGDHRFRFVDPLNVNPIDLDLTDFFGNPPKTIMNDISEAARFGDVKYDIKKIKEYAEMVMQLESVACKDWLTNKVDRSVTGKVAKQQCAGELQLPLNNLGAVALDYRGQKGIATSIGHAPAAGMVDPKAGSVLAIAEALTNIIWAPLTDRIKSISLSANWMWPCKNPGEDARLYDAVQAASDFAIALGINIPTGKDSLSMTQKYEDGPVYSPGTVIISAGAEISDIRKIVEPVVKTDTSTFLVHVDLSGDDPKLGGSSLGQVLNFVGKEAPRVKDPHQFVKGFNTIQDLIDSGDILAGHDISAGGILTTLLEMNFSNAKGGMTIDLSYENKADSVALLFSENPGLVIQVRETEKVFTKLNAAGIKYRLIGSPIHERKLLVKTSKDQLELDIDALRDKWFETSYLMDRKQSGEQHASERLNNYKNQALKFELTNFNGKFNSLGIDPGRRKSTGIKAAIIREKGVNGDREMAYMLYMAGFDVKDVHMTDLISGRENLEDLNMIVFVGGFSNSDVLGSAKGWAGAFRFNEKAKLALENFYKRSDTLSLGVCNGCQLMIELALINPEHEEKPNMLFNASHKFESNFLNVEIGKNNSVMMKSLEGKKLGVWVAHGEGQFHFPYEEEKYQVPIKYSHSGYPGNPNGSDFNTAGICSRDGRHFAMMPHLERSFMPWQCAYYPEERKNDDVTPWIEAFLNARQWIVDKTSK